MKRKSTALLDLSDIPDADEKNQGFPQIDLSDIPDSSQNLPDLDLSDIPDLTPAIKPKEPVVPDLFYRAAESVSGITKAIPRPLPEDTNLFDLFGEKSPLFTPAKMIAKVEEAGPRLKEAAQKQIGEFVSNPPPEGLSEAQRNVIQAAKAVAGGITGTVLESVPVTPTQGLEFAAVGKGLEALNAAPRAGSALNKVMEQYFPKAAKVLFKERPFITPETRGNINFILSEIKAKVGIPQERGLTVTDIRQAMKEGTISPADAARYDQSIFNEMLHERNKGMDQSNVLPPSPPPGTPLPPARPIDVVRPQELTPERPLAGIVEAEKTTVTEKPPEVASTPKPEFIYKGSRYVAETPYTVRGYIGNGPSSIPSWVYRKGDWVGYGTSVRVPEGEIRDELVKIKKPEPPPPPSAEQAPTAMVEAPAIESKPKEPWEMTRFDYADSKKTNIIPGEFEVLEAISDRNNRKPYNPDVITKPSVKLLRDQGLITGIKNLKVTQDGFSKLYEWKRLVKENDMAQGDASDQHIELVQQAIIAGKPVPPEVLAEYPDLRPTPAPKSLPTPQATKGITPEIANQLLALPVTDMAHPTGDTNAELRRDILEAITGTRPPKAKAGATIVRETLASYFGVDVKGLAPIQIESKIIEGLKKVAEGKKEPTVTAEPEVKQAEQKIVLLDLSPEDFKLAEPLIPDTVMKGSGEEEGYVFGVKAYAEGKTYAPDPGLGGGMYGAILRGYKAAKQSGKFPAPKEITKPVRTEPAPTIQTKAPKKATPEPVVAPIKTIEINPTEADKSKARTPKDQRAYAIKTINELIAEAESVPVPRRKDARMDEKGVIHAGEMTSKEKGSFPDYAFGNPTYADGRPLEMVRIKIPKDGNFKIYNTKEALTWLRDKLDTKSMWEMEHYLKNQNVSNPKPIAHKEEVGELKKLKGKQGDEYFTDGGILVKGKPPKGSEFEKHDFQTDVTSILSSAKEATIPAELQYYFSGSWSNPDLDSIVSENPVPSMGGDNTPIAILKVGDKYGAIAQKYVNLISNRFPKAKIFTDGKGKYVVKSDGEVVAMMMGTNVRSDSPSPETILVDNPPGLKDWEPAKPKSGGAESGTPGISGAMETKIVDIIKTSKSMFEARSTIKKDLGLDINYDDLKNYETLLKGGLPLDMSKPLFNSITEKIKDQVKKARGNADVDFGTKDFGVDPQDLQDSIKWTDIVAEKKNEIIDYMHKFELVQNFLYRSPEGKPVAEGVIDASVKQTAMNTRIHQLDHIVGQADNPQKVADLLVEADRAEREDGDIINVIKKVNEEIAAKRMTEKDKDALKAIGQLRKIAKEQLIADILESRLGVRVKLAGERVRVKYTLKDGTPREMAEATPKQLANIQKKMTNVEVLGTKQKIIFKRVDPETGKYVTETKLIDDYESEVPKMLKAEEQKLIRELLPYVNYIPHNRTGGKYWIEMFERLVGGGETKIFSTRVPNETWAKKLKEKFEAENQMVRVVISPHNASKINLPSVGSYADLQYALSQRGISPESEAGQKILNAYRSMSPLLSGMIHASNIAGYRVDFKSIRESMVQKAQAASGRAFRSDIKDLYEITGEIKDQFTKNTSESYIESLTSLKTKGNVVLNASKSLTYFYLLANKPTYVIQNLSEPIWAIARLPKLNNAAKFWTSLSPEYTKLMAKAKTEGIVKAVFSEQAAGSVFNRINTMGRWSESKSSEIVFDIGLRLARDRGLVEDEAYRAAYQFLFNIGKTFYNNSNTLIGLLDKSNENINRYGMMLLRWSYDFANKMATLGVPAFYKTLIFWLLIGGVSGIPYGRKLMEKLNFTPIKKDPKKMTWEERLIVGGVPAVMGISSRFLIPMMTLKGFGGALDPLKSLDIMAQKAQTIAGDYKKYGWWGVGGGLPLAGLQYPMGAIGKLKYGYKYGGKIFYYPKSDYEKAVVLSGMTPFAVEEWYRRRGEKTKTEREKLMEERRKKMQDYKNRRLVESMSK